MSKGDEIRAKTQKIKIPKWMGFWILLILIFIFPILFLVIGNIVPAPNQQKPPLLQSPRNIETPTTTLLAVGDILLSRHVGFQIDESGDIDLPFKNIGDAIRTADISFGNLECPLDGGNIPIRNGLIFRCLTKYVPGLKNSGFDILSTANNHSFDQGLDNLTFTAEYLRTQSILPVGTGRNFTEAHQGEIISKHSVKFGFLGYSYTAYNDGGKSTHPQIATTDDIEQLKKDIADLRNRGTQIVVISMHAGTEYKRYPAQNQIEFAHVAIDAGADIVIGHHPHWIQNIEIYQNKPIFYSLGNFVFDQMWSQDTREGLIVKLNFKKQKLISAELIPVIIENYCCPRLANDQEKIEILKKINLENDIIRF